MKRFSLLSFAGIALIVSCAFGAAPRAQDAGPQPPASAGTNAAQSQPASPSASSAGQQPAAAKASTSPQAKDAKVVVPVGTHIPLILHNAISTRTARPS